MAKSLARLAKAASMTGLAFLLFVLAAAPASAAISIFCYVTYVNPDGTTTTTKTDRGCNIQMAWAPQNGPDPGPGPDVISSRAFSCSLPEGASSCHVTINPVEYGVPADYVLKSVVTGLLYSPFEESRGCIYGNYIHENLQGRYPLVFSPGDPPDASVAFPYAVMNPVLGTATASHPFPLIFNTDPMPALPPFRAGEGEPLNIVVLHYFDCSHSL